MAYAICICRHPHQDSWVLEGEHTKAHWLGLQAERDTGPRIGSDTAATEVATIPDWGSLAGRSLSSRASPPRCVEPELLAVPLTRPILTSLV